MDLHKYRLKNLKEKRETVYLMWKLQSFQGHKSGPEPQAYFAHFTDATSSLSAKFWKDFHPNPGSTSDNAHTTKINPLIFFKKSFKKSQLFKLAAQKMGWKKRKSFLSQKSSCFLDYFGGRKRVLLSSALALGSYFIACSTQYITLSELSPLFIVLLRVTCYRFRT